MLPSAGLAGRHWVALHGELPCSSMLLPRVAGVDHMQGPGTDAFDNALHAYALVMNPQVNLTSCPTPMGSQEVCVQRDEVRVQRVATRGKQRSQQQQQQPHLLQAFHCLGCLRTGAAAQQLPQARS
jgi:hypothetical protein